MSTDPRLLNAISFYHSNERPTGDSAWAVGSIRAQIAWQPVLQIGAEELAKALGASIGTGLGQAFMDALLGKPNPDVQFQREVIHRLERIEQKLDSLISFIRAELPDFMQTLVREEFMEADRIALATARSQVGDAVAQVPQGNPPDADQIFLLEQAAIHAANCGERLLRRGPACYMAGVHALASMVAAYARIADAKPEKLRSLASRARVFAEITNSWIDPEKIYSYPALAAMCRRELDDARAALGSLPVDLLISITTPITWGGLTGLPNGSASFAYWGSFSRNTDGSIRGVFQDGDQVKQMQPASSEPVDPDQFARLMGLTTCSWWKVPVLKPWEGNPRQSASFFHQALQFLTLSAQQDAKHPLKIAEFDLASETLKSFQKSCRTLAAFD